MRVQSVGAMGVVTLALVVGAAAPSSVQAQKKSRELLTREEILKSPQADGDLFTAIRILKPNFFEAPRGLRSMGGTGNNGLAIYVDKIRQPGVDVLQNILANTVEEARYLDPNRSQNEYGITANGGAIVVKLYRAEKDTASKKPPR